MEQDLKVRENKARRAAARRGWKLEKSRSRDKHAAGYGLFFMADRTGKPLDEPRFMQEFPYTMTIEEVEARLAE